MTPRGYAHEKYCLESCTFSIASINRRGNGAERHHMGQELPCQWPAVARPERGGQSSEHARLRQLPSGSHPCHRREYKPFAIHPRREPEWQYSQLLSQGEASHGNPYRPPLVVSEG